MAFMGDILEPQSCLYRVVVHTELLCGVQRMRTALGTHPLPIICNPVLDQEQMDKYNLYREKVKEVKHQNKLQRRQEQSSHLQNLGSRERIKKVAAGFGTTDSMMEIMSDKMTDKILEEVGNMLATSLNTLATTDRSTTAAAKEERLEDTQAGTAVSLTTLRNKISQKNAVTEQISEAKSTLRQYVAEIREVEKNIFSTDLSQDNMMQWHNLEAKISNLQVNLFKLESRLKNLSMDIIMIKNKLGLSCAKL